MRQGDPLSPLLFVLVADVLNRMLGKVISVELVEGINLGRHGATLSYL